MRALLWSALFFLCACGSAPRARVAGAVDRGDFEDAYAAYEEFRSHEGTDVDLLGRVAGLLLERAVVGDDEELRRAALTQLALAGTAATPILERLADRDGLSRGRLGALTLLAQRGHEPSKLVLRSLADHEEPEILAASMLGMDPELDRALLLGHARSEHVEVRRAAALRMAEAAEVAEVARELERIAREDTEASVRSAAVRSLGRAGRVAVSILRERLSDPDASVRFAAISALMQADAEQARLAFAPLLEIAPSSAGIEAARLLAMGEDDGSALVGPDAARAYLLRALADADPAVRSQAGIALSSLPRDREPPLAELREALERERVDEVRLGLARALFRHEREAAERALYDLLESGDGMARVQAALLLASEGDRAAQRVLSDVASSHAPAILRRTAVRALARDAMQPDAARSFLRDEDALVRIYAAGGILAAAAAS